MSTTTTASPASPANGTTASGTPRRLLRGLPWVIYRRHRGLLITALLITLAGCATFLYQRFGVMDFLHAKGSTPDDDGKLSTSFADAFNSMFSRDISFLEFLPGAVAVFVGAPLIAGEQERGTIKLVTTQSSGRGRWITTTLGLPLAVMAVCTALLAVTFRRLWFPAHELVMGGDWLMGGAFETTGPGLVAMTLFLTACGIGLGLLIKRVVPAMAATAVLSFVITTIWTEKVRQQLGAFRSMTYPEGSSHRLPRGAVEIDQWVATADGKLYGYGTCTGRDYEACRAKLGIVNRVSQYFDFSQLAGMQWRGAGILLALTAIVLALVVWRVRRRPL
ncbi:ABC transporter permease subunit [Streptomyces sp. NPDC053427]|uniref:ABC transporter permease subunit n=1 Tax=Streptomyces sp. NPDC053427 TaxID=3365701 RepID=UPI0037D3B6AE